MTDLNSPIVHWVQEYPACPSEANGDHGKAVVEPVRFAMHPDTTNVWHCTACGTSFDGPDWQQDQHSALSRLVHEAIGAASTCWESMEGTGVFQEDRARQIANDVLRGIHDHYEVKTL